jgi:hypothetical protein
LWETIAKHSEIVEVELEFVIRLIPNSSHTKHGLDYLKNLLAPFVQKSNQSNHFKFNERNKPALGNEINVF